MAQRAIDLIRARTPSRTIPTLGLRGGLGKTLLIAFLLLAIIPLSLLAFLTYNRIQRDTGQRLGASLETVVALKEAHLRDWVVGYQRQLALLADDPNLADELASHLAASRAIDPAWVSLIVANGGRAAAVAATDPAVADLDALRPAIAGERPLVIVPDGLRIGGETVPAVGVGYNSGGRQLVALLRWEALAEAVIASSPLEEGMAVYLVTAEGLLNSRQGLTTLPLDGETAAPQGVRQALGGESGSGTYEGVAGEPVFGAYRWLPELGVALLAEYSQAEALAAGETVTALVVGATLAVALITAAIAAVATRRITRPIVQLTETAAWMARGDLNQEVTIHRQDEIGVLARAFNRMAAELRLLYSELEDKVAERTRQLKEAHERTRYYVMQLAISAEVARVASAIRDLDELLTTVAHLIGDSFELAGVSVYLLDEGGRHATWQAGNRDLPPAPRREVVGGETLVGRVAADGQRRVARRGAEASVPVTMASELAVPLRAREQVLGVLHLQSNRADDFDANDEMVYQSLADQIGIAIENVRAYALERETVEWLRELDRIQSEFLTNMSHALRTPLNSVIGFSRIMLRELDGPLTDLQRTDLTTIYESGRQLLGLINDMLDLSQLELGTAPFTLTEVDLGEIIEGVMATARALAMNKPIQVYEEVPDDLPRLYTDGQRVRQVILALLSNAVKFTDEGSIRLQASAEDGQVVISVHDTGIGISPTERAAIFSETQYDRTEGSGGRPGFGLAISKRVVEKLGGEIWVESEEGAGSTFTFALPLRAGMEESEPGPSHEGVTP